MLGFRVNPIIGITLNETFIYSSKEAIMINVGKDIRLTDELERQLMMQAIEDQFRFKPLVSLKGLFAKIAALFSSEKTAARRTVESAS